MTIFETAHRSYGIAAAICAAALSSAAGTLLRMGLASFAATRARHTARLLHELSDRQLKDIGVSRLDLGHLARAPLADKAPRLPNTD
ncbi:DUF1127 domain-containing protein [Pseudaminobacter sp. NGMCC 1.201702]|uniref:DUF1127 domain-containing protein n=1 Tax=Pseudaminobacter sp. NGMCC 1.201702 TaxID=3391825 RepID=UPI0039EFB55F